jgi:hypothetical protein
MLYAQLSGKKSLRDLVFSLGRHQRKLYHLGLAPVKRSTLADANERGYWGAYQRAYEEMIRATAAPYAPWYVVPADKKWFSRLVVAAPVNEAIDGLKLAYPKVDEAKKKELQAARAALGGKAKA